MPTKVLDTSVQDGATADLADGGFTVESHSQPDTPPPLDTTAAPIAAEAAEAAKTAAQTPPPAADDADDDGDDHPDTPVTPPVQAGSRDAGTGQYTKAKKKARYQELDRLRHDAERRAEDAERRLQALEAASKAPAPVADPAPPVKPAVDPQAMPAHPKYSDFETDEDYQDAVSAWHADVQTWQTAREERLKTDITSGLDARLSAQAQAAEQAVRFQTAKRAHPDFDAKVQANAAVLEATTSYFLQDMVRNTPDGYELLYDLASDPALTEALGALPLPTRPMADAIRTSPAARALVKYFATEDGQEAFHRLRTLQNPISVIREIGNLEARLDTADPGGPVPGAHVITNAAPPARPPVGTPRARPAPSTGSPTDSFDAWNAEEDRKERAAKRAALGLPISA